MFRDSKQVSKRPLVAFVLENITCVSKSSKIFIQISMVDWATFLILFHILFCYIGALGTTVDKNVVPGAILGGLAFSHLLVPVSTTLELWIDIDNNTAVLKKSVVD